jgi:hypothetical protein
MRSKRLFRRKPNETEAELRDQLLAMTQAYADARERSQVYNGIEEPLRVLCSPHEYSMGEIGGARADLKNRLIQLGLET